MTGKNKKASVSGAFQHRIRTQVILQFITDQSTLVFLTNHRPNLLYLDDAYQHLPKYQFNPLGLICSVLTENTFKFFYCLRQSVDKQGVANFENRICQNDLHNFLLGDRGDDCASAAG